MVTRWLLLVRVECALADLGGLKASPFHETDCKEDFPRVLTAISNASYMMNTT